MGARKEEDKVHWVSDLNRFISPPHTYHVSLRCLCLFQGGRQTTLALLKVRRLGSELNHGHKCSLDMATAFAQTSTNIKRVTILSLPTQVEVKNCCSVYSARLNCYKCNNFIMIITFLFEKNNDYYCLEENLTQSTLLLNQHCFALLCFWIRCSWNRNSLISYSNQLGSISHMEQLM